MARPKKTTKKVVKPTKTNKKTPKKAIKIFEEELELKENKPRQGIFEQLKLSESYVSLILGAVVVFAVAILFFAFFRENSLRDNSDMTKINVSPAPSHVKQKTYTLQDGEGLWDVAVKFYGDGYKYTELIKVNNFENPDDIPPGTKIVIPDIR